MSKNMMHKITLQKYKAETKSVISNLHLGVEEIRHFVDDFYSNVSDISDKEYVKRKLLPVANKASDYFKDTIDSIDQIDNMISRDLEQNVAEMAMIEIQQCEINKNMKGLECEIKGKDESIENAEKTLRSKKEQLDNAERVCSQAWLSLKQAEKTQNSTILGGGLFVLGALMSLPVSLPIAAVGLGAGGGLEYVGLTAMQENVEAKSHECSVARDEVSDSKSALTTARDARTNLKKDLTDLQKKYAICIKESGDKRTQIKEMRETIHMIAELNKNVKICYQQLSNFQSSVNVLQFQVKHGYLLQILREPTQKVCEALSTLVSSPDLYLIFEKSRIDCVKTSLLQIKLADWSGIKDYPDDVLNF